MGNAGKARRSVHPILLRIFLRLFYAAIAFFILITFSQDSSARDLHGRFGLGYNSQFASTESLGGPPGISVKYGLTRDIAASLVFGVATSDPVNNVTALKLFKSIFFETNLNFYFVLGAAILSGNNQSYTEFIGAFGSEFFIPGLESLGFSIETGVSLENTSGSFILQTMGVSFLGAGIHFYF